jgi:hypothetical protein
MEKNEDEELGCKCDPVATTMPILLCLFMILLAFVVYALIDTDNGTDKLNE